MTAGRRLVAVLAADIAGRSLCPHSTRSIVDGVASAFQLREIHERIRERFAVRIPYAPPPSRTELTYFPSVRNRPTFPRLGAWEFGLAASRRSQPLKFQLRFRERVWRAAGCSGEIRLRSDFFQTTWDVTRAQAGDAGILNFWCGGKQAERSAALDPVDLARSCLAEAEKLLPGLTAAWTGEMTRDAWRGNPWSLGSYSYQPVGYATALSGIEAEPESNCFFAGEHTVRGRLYELGRRRQVSSEKARRMLGWTTRPVPETILDTARSLQAQRLV